jgi:branched-chain amino acid transport system permease protein
VTDLFRYAVQGFPVGCVYALVATGLVLTYKTSGVFNLAFGAQAYLSAAVFYELRREHDWSRWPALLVAVFVVAPLLGLVLDRFLFRFLRGPAPLARLVCALGLLLALPQLVQIWFGTGAKFAPPSVALNPDASYELTSSVTINGDELTTIVVTLAVVVGLTLLFRSSTLGLRMRAVVESPRLLQLAGVNSDRVSTVAWMLSSLLAGIAGVLLAPLFQSVDAGSFTVLIVAATTAAAFGGLSSIPLTFAGGLVLGVAQQVVAGYLPLDSVLARGLRPSLPFLMLFLLLLLWPPLRRPRDAPDPMAGVDPPPPALAVTYQDPRLARFSRVLFVVFVATVTGLSLFVISDFWLFLLTQGFVYTTIFLSITVITGMAGQISLCQATFAGVGAFTAAQLAVRFDVPILLGILAGGLVAAAVGVIVAIPAVRLGGLYLALATLAFGLMVESVFFPLDWVSGGDAGVAVPRPVLGPVDFSDDRAFFLLAFAVFGLVGAAVVLVRRGTTGQFLAALRGSEVAANSIGINPLRARITVFALSAAIAGLGGGMLASLEQSASIESYLSLVGVAWVVVVVTLGARTVDGAVNAGMAFIFLPELLTELGVSSSLVVPIQFTLFGLGAVTFAKHPEGAVDFYKRRSIEWVNLRIRRRYGEPAEVAVPSSSA